VTQAGLAYARIYWGGGVFVLLQLAGDAVFRARGNTVTPLRIAITTLVLNVVLDPLLIWGWGPVPALGVAGAALATVLASLAGAGLSVLALLRRGHLQRSRPPDAELRLVASTRLGHPGRLGLDATILGRMARVGTPTMAASVGFNLILLEMLRVAQRAGGPAAQAGLGIGHTGEGIAFVICLGWSAAAASLVGRHLGAGQVRAAEKAAWRSALQCGALCLVWALALFLLDEPIAALFAEEPAAQAYAASYFRIVALCLVPQAYELVLDGAFGGAGMTVPPMVVGLSLAAARIPLAWWAAFDLGLGVDGIWWVICATAALRGLIVAAWFARGTWKTRSV
jgi:putative MATE family efflux protein